MDETAKLSLQEIQAIEFSMLEFLDSVCVEEGIEYCLFYGSALGAVRHGGFIPWDDDIDVAIKREDCERLFSAIEQNTNDRYRVLRPFNPPDYRHPYAKMITSYRETGCFHAGWKPSNHGLSPFPGIPTPILRQCTAMTT